MVPTNLESRQDLMKGLEPAGSSSPQQDRPEAGPEVTSRSKRPARGWERLGWMTFGVLCSLLLLELLVRWFVPNPNMQVRGLYLEDSDGLRLRPGWQGRIRSPEFDVQVTIGADGLRAVPTPNSWNGRTILVLGDSFAFGCWSSAERTWLAGLARATGAKVVSAGQPNAGTEVAANWLCGPGAARPADLVLLEVYPGNDLYDNLLGPDAFTLESGLLVLKPHAADRWEDYDGLTGPPETSAKAPPASRRPWLRRMLARSQAWQVFRSVLRQTSKPLHPSLPQAWFLRSYPREMKQALEVTTRHLDRILAETTRRGLPLVLVVVPSSLEVEDEAWRAWLEHTGLPEALFDRSRPRRFMLEWARSRGVAALDLLTDLRGPQRVYYRTDIHWNDLGHQRAGHSTARFLHEKGLLAD